MNEREQLIADLHDESDLCRDRKRMQIRAVGLIDSLEAQITALTAERDALRGQVAAMREAADVVLTNEEHAFSGGMRKYSKGSQTWEAYEGLRKAVADTATIAAAHDKRVRDRAIEEMAVHFETIAQYKPMYRK